jgi:hypothetical protein
MISTLLRHHRLFLINFTTASGLLAAGDLSVQIFYEKKKTLDEKRLRMYRKYLLININY